MLANTRLGCPLGNGSCSRDYAPSSSDELTGRLMQVRCDLMKMSGFL